jgi:Rrf2 family protein
MKFSTRTLYGLRAVLVLASRFGEGSVSVSQIARKEAISTPYLEQILNSLKKKGMVKSVRGPQGGYVLAKKPAEITLEGLLRVLDDDPFLERRKSESPNKDEVAFADQIFWKKLGLSIQDALSKVSLKELLDESRRVKKTKSSSSYNFQI